MPSELVLPLKSFNKGKKHKILKEHYLAHLDIILVYSCIVNLILDNPVTAVNFLEIFLTVKNLPKLLPH